MGGNFIYKFGAPAEKLRNSKYKIGVPAGQLGTLQNLGAGGGRLVTADLSIVKDAAKCFETTSCARNRTPRRAQETTHATTVRKCCGILINQARSCGTHSIHARRATRQKWWRSESSTRRTRDRLSRLPRRSRLNLTDVAAPEVG